MTKSFTIALIVILLVPLEAFAAGSASGEFDGGELQGVDRQCSCSGGQTIKIYSYVDDSQHVYVNQYGATQLYKNYNLTAYEGYFLTTLVSGAVCMVVKGNRCESEGDPEGIFMKVGTSFNDNKQTFLALLKQFPGISEVSGALSKYSLLSEPIRKLF